MPEKRMSTNRLTQVGPSRFEARLADEDLARLGNFVLVEDSGTRVLAMVNRSQADDAGFRVVLLPLGEVDDGGRFQRGVRHYPVPGAGIRGVADDQVGKMFSTYSAFRFAIGEVSNRPGQMVFLNPSALFGRSFTILGQSGSGKSWTVASLLQQTVAAMPRAHVILLDLHGEYCWRDQQGELHSAFAEGTYRYVDARALEIPYWLMTYSELIDLLIDRDDKSASIQMAFLRETLHRLKKREAERLEIGFVSIDAPIWFSIEDVYREFKTANELRTDFGKTKGPLFGQFDEFLVKLQSRLNDVRYDFLLKPRRRTGSESLARLLRDFVGLGDPKCQITVIDLSGVPFDVRPAVSAQIGRLAFEFNYWNPRRREFPILLVCEEAHQYLPRDGDPALAATRKAMERIAKEGRKYGVGLCVISQRPTELSETVLAQCSNYLCLRISNPDDQAYVRGLMPEGEADMAEILASLSRGEVLAVGDATPLPTRFQVYPPNPPPASADVPLSKSWRNGPEDLDVMDIVQHWWQQQR